MTPFSPALDVRLLCPYFLHLGRHALQDHCVVADVLDDVQMLDLIQGASGTKSLVVLECFQHGS